MTMKFLTRAAAGAFVAGAVMMAGDGGISYAGASPSETFNNSCQLTAPGGALQGPIFNTRNGPMMFETCANGGHEYTGRVFGNRGGQAFLYKNFDIDDKRGGQQFQRELDRAVSEDARNQQNAVRQAQRDAQRRSTENPIRDATRDLNEIRRGAGTLDGTVRTIDRLGQTLNGLFK